LSQGEPGQVFQLHITACGRHEAREHRGNQRPDRRAAVQLQKLTSTVTSVTGKQIKSTQESLETAIRDNPFAAVGIALGLGFLYG
jgi:ElaB/YqjD/DUF883 family membrane-anchored ribosome-binding protein